MKVLLTATVQSHIVQFHKPLVEMLHAHGCEVHVAARDNLVEKNGLKLDFVDKVYNVPFARSPKSTDNIKDTGVPIWYSKDCKTIWFDRETPHYVYLGSTGCGKSVTCVIPTCSFIANSKNKRSVFITDPKGEIYNTTSQMFKDNGYEIYTIDFRKPELSNKINLLEPIIKEYELYIKNDDEYKKFESDIQVLESSIELDKDKPGMLLFE